MTVPANNKSFASDNNSGIHPAVIEAIARANVGDSKGYGADPYTASVTDQFRELFDADVDVNFVFNGTGANVLALSSVLDSFDAVICAAGAHINVDECGAPERIIGCKLIDLPTPDGKLTPELVATQLHGFGDQHHVQAKAISITQSTELGTLYTAEEITRLADLAHRHAMFLHVDGARISNATAALGGDIRSLTRDAGVDVLSFGGTKNGMMVGEAVIDFRSTRSPRTMFLRKQQMQLASKMRFIAAQFGALLTDDLWLKNATHANAMGARLARRVEAIPGVMLTQKNQVNSVFATVPPAIIPLLLENYFFYEWDESLHEVRWMTSFDTTEADVDRFADAVEAAVSATTHS